MSKRERRDSIQFWHNRSADDCLKKLGSTPLGLSQSEANIRLDQYGLNRLPELQSRSALMRFLLQFHNVLIYVLLARILHK